MKLLFDTFRIAAVTEASIHEALDLKWDDFEDSVQYTAGKKIQGNYVITRNAKDYGKSETDALSPKELLEMITASKKDS